MKSIAGAIRMDIPTVPAAPRSADGASKAPTISVPKAALRCLKAAAAVPGFPAVDPVPLSGRCPS
jgi:hypothetical protein